MKRIMIAGFLMVFAALLCALPARAADQNWELLFEDKLDKTEGIAVCPNGRMFVAELERGTVYEIISDTEAILVAEDFEHPAGMACGADNTLYILLYADGGVDALTLTDQGVERKSLSDKLTTPNAMVVASDGTLYISETDNARVVTLGQGGEPVEVVGGVTFANGVALNEDETMLYVNSTTGGKVYVTPLQGEHKGKKKTIAKAIQMADGIVRAPDGALYVPSYAMGDIYVIDAENNKSVIASGLNSPASPALWNGALYMTSLNGKGVYKIQLPE